MGLVLRLKTPVCRSGAEYLNDVEVVEGFH
jgi:hypothetical protein